ncbi:MAG: zf-HC2 domain-containing protein, partial [Firmicutes bacterium]|nr:zf-HC2 domain-containing protein [Bacillota bacterium]
VPAAWRDRHPAARSAEEGSALKFCAEIRVLLVDLVYGELAPEEAEACRAHLAVCPGCRVAADELAALRSVLNRLIVPAADRARMEEALRLVKRRLAVRRRVETMAFAATAAAILGLVWAGLSALDPRLPLYFQIGIALNLCLFYLPIHLSRPGEGGGA